MDIILFRLMDHPWSQGVQITEVPLYLPCNILRLLEYLIFATYTYIIVKSKIACRIIFAEPQQLIDSTIQNLLYNKSDLWYYQIWLELQVSFLRIFTTILYFPFCSD